MSKRSVLGLAALFAAVSVSSAFAQAAPPAAGIQTKAWNKCRACHTVDDKPTPAGPSLKGVYGSKSGSRPGYAYSPAVKNAGVVWNDKTLDAYLMAPRKVIAGSRMAFIGMPSAEERAAVIAYLKTAR